MGRRGWCVLRLLVVLRTTNEIVRGITTLLEDSYEKDFAKKRSNAKVHEDTLKIVI